MGLVFYFNRSTRSVLTFIICFIQLSLTHYSPVLLIYTPWKQKTFRFCHVFRGQQATPDCNKLINAVLSKSTRRKELFLIAASCSYFFILWQKNVMSLAGIMTSFKLPYPKKKVGKKWQFFLPVTNFLPTIFFTDD